MALSDQLSTLAAQTRDLEESAKAARDTNDAHARERLADITAKVDAAKASVASELAATSAQADDDWSSLKKRVSEHFDGLRANIAQHSAEHKAAHAARKAEDAEADAEDAVNFAVYAVQEAEYYVLAAAVARVKSEDLND